MTATTKRKYVEKEVMEDYSFPKENQSILKITRSRGNNLHQVVTSTGEEFLVSMPPKFRKYIWIKRGNYVVTEPIKEGNKVKAEIVRILFKDQIKYYIQQNVWPEGFRDDFKELFTNEEPKSSDDELLMRNPNRPHLYYNEESDSENETSDEDSENETSDEGSENETSDEDSENETSDEDSENETSDEDSEAKEDDSDEDTNQSGINGYSWEGKNNLLNDKS